MYEVCLPTPPHRQQCITAACAELKNASAPSKASCASRFELRSTAAAGIPLAATVKNRMLKLLRRSNSTRGTRETHTSVTSAFGSGGIVISNKRYSMAGGAGRVVVEPPSSRALLTEPLPVALSMAAPLPTSVSAVSQFSKNATAIEDTKHTPSTSGSNSKPSTVSHKEKLARVKEGDRVMRRARKHSRQTQQQLSQAKVMDVAHRLLNLSLVREGGGGRAGDGRCVQK